MHSHAGRERCTESARLHRLRAARHHPEVDPLHRHFDGSSARALGFGPQGFPAMAKHHLAWVAALGLWCGAGSAMASADPTLQTTRKIVFEKVDQAYRYKLTEGPVAALGDHQVLVHMRAVALNRGDWETLTTATAADMSGRIAGSDGAGDVVAVGRAVREFYPADKVTRLYFRHWTGSLPDAPKLSEGTGPDGDGVVRGHLVAQ